MDARSVLTRPRTALLVIVLVVAGVASVVAAVGTGAVVATEVDMAATKSVIVGTAVATMIAVAAVIMSVEAMETAKVGVTTIAAMIAVAKTVAMAARPAAINPRAKCEFSSLSYEFTNLFSHCVHETRNERMHLNLWKYYHTHRERTPSQQWTNLTPRFIFRTFFSLSTTLTKVPF